MGSRPIGVFFLRMVVFIGGLMSILTWQYGAIFIQGAVGQSGLQANTREDINIAGAWHLTMQRILKGKKASLIIQRVVISGLDGRIPRIPRPGQTVVFRQV